MFGDNATIIFLIPYVPAPSLQPPILAVPSSSPPPSFSPSLSLSPTETCYLVEVNILADNHPSETSWSISKMTTANGTLEVKSIYGSNTIIDFQVDGRTYSADHIDNSASDTVVNGVLCDCGLGTGQCECQGEVCLIERGDNMFHEKVANCEVGGGLAAVIYDNGGETSLGWTLHPKSADTPAVFISQADGQYLLDYGLGQFVSMTASGSPIPLKANVLNSHRVCLKEGQYKFTIYDNRGDGICCAYFEGGYNVTSVGEVIAQGGQSGRNESTIFNVPFNGL